MAAWPPDYKNSNSFARQKFGKFVNAIRGYQLIFLFFPDKLIKVSFKYQNTDLTWQANDFDTR